MTTVKDFLFGKANSIPKHKWGPSAWATLHSITYMYPRSPSYMDQKVYQMAIVNILRAIPCEECSQHAINYIRLHPLDEDTLEGRVSLAAWVWEFHNTVNSRLGKPTLSWTQFLEVMVVVKDDPRRWIPFAYFG